jgi:hypothetical protein
MATEDPFMMARHCCELPVLYEGCGEPIAHASFAKPARGPPLRGAALLSESPDEDEWAILNGF